MSVNGTYICQKHDQISSDADRIITVVETALRGDDDAALSLTDLEEILGLAESIAATVANAKIDGQKMEDRLVERSMQGDAILHMAMSLGACANVLKELVPADHRPKRPRPAPPNPSAIAAEPSILKRIQLLKSN